MINNYKLDLQKIAFLKILTVFHVKRPFFIMLPLNSTNAKWLYEGGNFYTNAIGLTTE